MVAIEPDRSASYLEAVRKLAPLIAERRAAFDRERRLTDDVFEALEHFAKRLNRAGIPANRSL